MAARDYACIYSVFIQPEEQNQNIKQFRKTLQNIVMKCSFFIATFGRLLKQYGIPCLILGFFMASQYMVN